MDGATKFRHIYQGAKQQQLEGKAVFMKESMETYGVSSSEEYKIVLKFQRVSRESQTLSGEVKKDNK